MKLAQLLVGIALLSPFPALGEDPVDVSLIQLIAAPEQHDGKLVRVVAFLHLEFEGDALYVHKEDFAHHISKNSIYLLLDGRHAKTYQLLSGDYVIAEGVFDGKYEKVNSYRSGVLKDVRRLERWPPLRP